MIEQVNKKDELIKLHKKGFIGNGTLNTGLVGLKHGKNVMIGYPTENDNKDVEKIGELVYYTRNNKPYGKREYCIIQEIKKEFNEFGSGYLISGCWKETRNQAKKCGHTRGQDYGFMRSGELYADDIKIIETNIAKEIFDKFDKYSCIKNDKWYKELKKKY